MLWLKIVKNGGHKLSNFEQNGKDLYDSIIQGITNDLQLDADTASAILDEYIGQLPDEIANLKNSIENNDFTSGAAIAHSIKGASGNLRIMQLHKITAELEQALKNSQAETAFEMMSQLDTFMAVLLSR